MAERFDVVVIGAGVVGLSAAWAALERFPRLRLLVLEKESRVAAHQSGHNSGVIHSGLYYKPGSRKARMCVAGAAAMIDFCREHDVPHAVCGKLVVAATADEVAGLHRLHERGLQNGLTGLRLLTAEEAREIEPHCYCRAALHVPTTAVTDFAAVCRKYAELARMRGGEVRCSSEVVGITPRASSIIVQTRTAEIETARLINCAGLQSDRIMRLAGELPETRIVPFRGEYYELRRPELVRALLYPVPDPRFPFLGVHFTHRVTGEVEAGPNAVLSFKREGYTRSAFSARDTYEALTWPGLWRLGLRHWRTQAGEFRRSCSRGAFANALQRMVPELVESDLRPGGSGVRAQAVARDGSLVDDFLFVTRGRMLHVCNVPSPAATASIPIGQAIVQMAHESCGLGT